MTDSTPAELAARWPPEQSHPVVSVAAKAWDEGYRRGLLDEGSGGVTPNPYRRAVDLDVDMTGSWPVWDGDE